MSRVVYRELLPPTGIHSAVFARITSPHHKNLVVARASGLDVYDVTKTGLHVACTTELHGVVKSLATVTVRGSCATSITSLINDCEIKSVEAASSAEVDVLIATFGYGKVSMLVWDAIRHELRTVGLLNFEEASKGVGSGTRVTRHALNPCGFTANPVALVDPKHTCVALALCEDQIAVVPLRQDELEGPTGPSAGPPLPQGLFLNTTVDVKDPWAEACASADAATQSFTMQPFVCSLPSVTSTLTPEGIVGNLIDAVFLFGYFQPTLALLLETSASAVSRIAVKSFTCAVVVVTFDVLAKKPSVIWRFDSLPTDSRSLFSVPDPAGGVIVASTNGLTYLNQHNSFVLPTNTFASSTIDMPRYRAVDNPSHLPLDCALDGSKCQFVSPTLAVLTARSGDMFTLRLKMIAGAVEAMILAQEQLTTVATSCFAASRDGDSTLLFQGSRVCDSLLLHLSFERHDPDVKPVKRSLEVESVAEAATEADCCDEAPVKKSKVEAPGDDEDAWLYGDSTPASAPAIAQPLASAASVATTVVDDELEALYGASVAANTQAAKIETQKGNDDTDTAIVAVVIDSIRCLGPVSDTIIGQATRTEADASDVRVFSLKLIPRDVMLGVAVKCQFPMATVRPEVILCSGHDNHGSITVVSRSLQPSVHTVLPVSQAVATYTVPDLARGCCLLFVVSASGGTRVFEVNAGGECLETLHKLGSEGWSGAEFVLDAITCGVGVATFPPTEKAVLLQAHGYGVRVFDGNRTLQDVLVAYDMDVGGLGAPEALVRDMHVLGNTVVLLLSDGTIRCLTIDAADFDVSITNPLDTDDPAWVDSSLVTAATLLALPADASTYPSELLSPPVTESTGSSTEAPFVCAVARSNGCLQLFSLPSWTLLFEAGVLHGPSVAVSLSSRLDAVLQSGPLYTALTGSEASVATPRTPSAAPPAMQSVSSSVSAITFVALPQPTFVMTLTNTDVLVYGVHPWAPHTCADRVTWQADRELRLIRRSVSAPQRLRSIDNDALHSMTSLKPLRPHAVVSSLPGCDGAAVVCMGPSPFVLFSCRGSTKAVSLWPPTLNVIPPRTVSSAPANVKPYPVTAFAELPAMGGETPTCLYAFEDSIHLARLPDLTDASVYDCGSGLSVVVNDVPLDCAARHAVYLSMSSVPTMQLYAVSACVGIQADLEAEAQREAQLCEDEGEEHDQIAMRWGPKEELCKVDVTSDGAPPLMDVAHEVRLYVGGTWEHVASFGLDVSERVLCMCEVSLLDARDRPQALIAVGTGYLPSRGEDANPYGRLILLKYDFTEEGVPNLRLFYSKHVKGAVSSVVFVKGKHRYIVVAAGSRIEVLAWRQERGSKWELTKIGFLDVYSYVTDMACVKSFVCFADAYKSLHFLRVNEVSASSVTLAYLAKDYYAACTSCTQFLSDGRSLVLASADLDKNVQFFQYEPSQASSDNTLAMPLDRKADFHLGSTVCRMASVGLNATVWGGYHATSVRFGAVFGTVDGGVGSFVPVDEVQFKRLIALQKLMTYALPHAAGLNPKDHRLFRSVESKRLVRNKNVVDGNLVWRYASLDRRVQRELARAINTTVDRILTSLREIDLAISVF